MDWGLVVRCGMFLQTAFYKVKSYRKSSEGQTPIRLARPTRRGVIPNLTMPTSIGFSYHLLDREGQPENRGQIELREVATWCRNRVQKLDQSRGTHDADCCIRLQYRRPLDLGWRGGLHQTNVSALKGKCQPAILSNSAGSSRVNSGQTQLIIVWLAFP